LFFLNTEAVDGERNPVPGYSTLLKLSPAGRRNPHPRTVERSGEVTGGGLTDPVGKRRGNVGKMKSEEEIEI
jgi:hypothetical protein